MKRVDKMGSVIGIGCCLFAIFLYCHEMATGGEYIRIVEMKAAAIYGMKPAAARVFAIAFILIAPIISIASTLPFRAKR